MLDFDSEDIDGMDADEGDDEEPAPIRPCKATSSYDIYMVDTPKEGDGDGTAEDDPSKKQPKHRRQRGRSKSRCRCQNRGISGRGSRTVRLGWMVTGDKGHEVLPRFGPSRWR